jgi:hypothetical protein
MHPGLASVQPVYSGFGNYIVGEWPTIGHKWLLSVVFVLMDERRMVTFYNEMVRSQITRIIGYAGHNAK